MQSPADEEDDARLDDEQYDLCVVSVWFQQHGVTNANGILGVVYGRISTGENSIVATSSSCTGRRWRRCCRTGIRHDQETAGS